MINGLILKLKDRELGLCERPYATMEIETEDDYNFITLMMQKTKILKARESQTDTEIEYICPRCGRANDVVNNYCYNCGQAIITRGI